MKPAMVAVVHIVADGVSERLIFGAQFYLGCVSSRSRQEK